MSEGELLVAVLDTCVLMRAGLVEFLVRVRSTGAYVAKWSDAISDELDDVLPKRPEGAAERIRAALVQVPDARLPVIRKDDAEAQGKCQDSDRHVLAAAICARRTNEDADIFLVTDNVRDFDKSAAAVLGIGVVEPDEFGVSLLERRPLPVLRTVQRQPPDRFERYLDRMRSDGMTTTADAIESLFRELDSEL